jgi:large subunit ribosomal protein L32e
MSKEKKVVLNELADLPHYKAEYTEQLEDMGIKTLPDLKKALQNKETSKKIVDDLVGVGPKIMANWKELLDAVPDVDEKALAHASAKKVTKKAKEDVEIVEQAETQIVEKDGYVVKKKPELDEETKKLLALRYEMSHDRIAFLRQEWFRFPRLGEKWRRPRGMHSKMRRHIQYRPNVVSIGYRGPAKVRCLHPSGFQEVMVWNPDQLDKVDPKVQAVRVGGSVGFKKRQAIEKKADELGIRVLNRTG